MTAQELMNPRFEVIADYPSSQLEIGSIIEIDKDEMFKIQEGYFFGLKRIEQYPHLFRKLNWWENRKIEDMPKKIKAEGYDNIYEIEEWDMSLMIGWLDKKHRTCCNLCLFKPEYGYFPID